MKDARLEADWQRWVKDRELDTQDAGEMMIAYDSFVAGRKSAPFVGTINPQEIVKARAAERERCAKICRRPWKYLASGKDWPLTKDQTAFVNDIMGIRAEEMEKEQ